MPLFRRFGRPGLLGLAAGTAVVAGTASAVSGGMRRNQARREQQAYEADHYETAEQAQATTEASLSAEIQKLGALNRQGLLTDAEFADAKTKLLAG